MRELLEDITRRAQAGEAVAVCVVVRTRGSTPQKAGATMLVLQSGRTLGTLGGGCVEAEVSSRALRLMQAGEVTFRGRLLTFKLDHDYGWDDGLVCGGSMDVAVQIIATPDEAAPWHQAREALAAGRQAIIAIQAPDDAGQLQRFDHVIDPPPSLVIAGAGHVGTALAQIAHALAFDVTVIDDRADYASPQRLAHARCVVGAIDVELTRMRIHEQTYVVIVTRGHRHDAAALKAVIDSPARYIGLIGSRRKIITILEGLREDGVAPQRLTRVHAPIGLAVGAVTPAEIAVSIAAELIAVHRGVDAAATGSMRLDPAHLAHVLAKAPGDGVASGIS